MRCSLRPRPSHFQGVLKDLKLSQICEKIDKYFHWDLTRLESSKLFGD